MSSNRWHRYRPELLRGEIFRGSDAIRDGALSSRQLRQAPWIRLFHDVYIDGTDVDVRDIPHVVRCRAATLILPTSAVFVARSAGHLHDVFSINPTGPVEVLLPYDAPQTRVKGIKVYTGEYRESDVVIRKGLRVLLPCQVAVEAARRLILEDAVMLIDALARAFDLYPQELLAALQRGKTHARGHSRAKQAIALMDPRSESPQESRLRVMLAQRDLLPPQAQYEIHDAAGFVARVDFAWPRRRLAVEYDGAWHAEGDQPERDRRREERLTDCGWTVIRVNVDRLKEGISGIAAEIRQALQQLSAVCD